MKIAFSHQIHTNNNPVFTANKKKQGNCFGISKPTQECDSFIRSTSYKSSKRTSPNASKDLLELSIKPRKNKSGKQEIILPSVYQNLLNSYEGISPNRHEVVKTIMQKDISENTPFGESKSFYQLVLNPNGIYDDIFFDRIQKRGLMHPDRIYAAMCLGNLDDKEWGKIKDIDLDVLAAIASNVEPDDLENFASGQISYNDILQKVSRENIKSVLYTLPPVFADDATDKVCEMINNGGVQASNFEMMLQLIEENKITPALVINFMQGSKVDKNAGDDLDKLYTAYAEGKNPKDVFVPEFKSDEEAFFNLKTGDIYHVEGRKNINIITNEKRKKEIGLSKDTFLELFPPIERYAYSQQAQGNCWFISTLNAIYSNPKTRLEILRCFKENNDGTIDVCLDGYETYNGVSTKIKPNSFECCDIGKNLSKELQEDRIYLSASCEGIRILEEVYEKEQETKAFENIKDKYRKFRYTAQKGLDSYTETDGFQYSKEEIEEYMMLFEKCQNDPKIASNYLFDTSRKPLMLNYPTVAKKLIELLMPSAREKYSPEEIQKMTRTLFRYKKYYEDNNADGTAAIPQDILPVDVYFNLAYSNKNDWPEKNIYSHSGNHSEALDIFGFSSIVYDMHNMKDVINLCTAFSNMQTNSEMIILASTDERAGERQGLRANHGYSVKLSKNKGKPILSVKDPANTFCEKEYTLQEFFRNFALVTIAHPKYI